MKNKNKPLKIVFYTFLTIVVSLFLIFVSILQFPFDFISYEDANIYTNENLLLDTYNQNINLANTPINKIALLGSHDAFSYGITYNSAPNSSEDTISNSNWAVLAKGIISRLSKAQVHDALTQLKAGVRYFDARITLVNGEYYTSHGVLSVKLCDVIKQIISFLSSHNGEFVIFHIAKNYPLASSYQPLAEYIDSIKVDNKSLFDFVNYDTTITNPNLITYNNATANQTKGGVVFLSSSFGVETEYEKYFKISAVSVWHNMMDHTSMLQKVQENYLTITQNLNYNNKFCINQLQSTPNFTQPLQTLLSWSLLNKAQKDNLESVSHPNFSLWLQAMPIVIFDYTTSTYKNFYQKIVGALTSYNLLLNY